MDNSQAAVRRWTRRHSVHDLAGAVGGTIVDRDYFVIVVVERQQTAQALLNICFFVACRHDDADAWMIAGLTVPMRLGNVGNTGHTQRRFRNAREPG